MKSHKYNDNRCLADAGTTETEPGLYNCKEATQKGMGIYWDFTQVPLNFEISGSTLSHVAEMIDSSGCYMMTCGPVVSPGQGIEEQADEKMSGDQKPSPSGSAVLRPKMGDSKHYSALLEFFYVVMCVDANSKKSCTCLVCHIRWECVN